MATEIAEKTEIESRKENGLKGLLSREFTFLEQSLPVGSRLMAIAAALVLTFVFFFPLWNMKFYSNQYPDGLELYIYAR
jgi:hypothetical protein